MTTLLSSALRQAGWFLLPFLLFLVVDQLLGRQSYSFPNDNIPGFFGMGLNVASGSVLYFHHPAVFFQEVVGLLAWLSLDAPSLDRFYWLGLVTQLLMVGATAVLAGFFACRLALPGWCMALLSLAVTIMPTVALYGPLYVTYVPCAFLAVTVALGFCCLSVEAEPPGWVVAWTFSALGFLAANLLLGLVLVAGIGAAVLALAVAEGWRTTLVRVATPPPGRLMAIVQALAWVVFLVALIDLVRTLFGLRLPVVQRWLAAAIFGLPLWLLVGKSILRGVRDGAFGHLLFGWLVGANLLAPRWGTLAKDTLGNKGNASPHLPIGGVWQQADPMRFLSAWHWHLLLPATAVAAIVLLVLAVSQKRNRVQLLAAGVFTLVALCANVIIAADVSFLRPSLGLRQFGQESRYFLMSVGALAVAAVVSFRFGGWLRWAAAATLMAGSLLSLMDYAAVTRVVWPAAERREHTLQALIDRHLAAVPTNQVVCIGTVQPRPCAMLYGYANYRTPKSAAILSRDSLAGGRVRFARNSDAVCVDGACSGELLIIAESSSAPGTASLFDDGVVSAVLLRPSSESPSGR